MKFKVGQQIVSKSGDWADGFSGRDMLGPKGGEIVTVLRYSGEAPGFVSLVEYPTESDGWVLVYHESFFEPIADIRELEEILEKKSIAVK